jgi:hypothetical protein
MSEFEFYFSFYGLLLGFSVAVVIGGLAKTLNAEREKSVGLLTLATALFILMDIASFWLIAWGERERFVISFAQMLGALAVAATYYLSASLVFPEADSDWDSTDAHYWAKKQRVFGGILAANGAMILWTLWLRAPAYDDWLFYLWQITYFGPLIALLFTRRRAVDLALIATLILFYLAAASELFPESDWGAGTPM